MITGDHDDLDASRSALGNSVGDSSSGRINHGDKTNKAQVVHGKVHFVRIKWIAFRELVSRQLQVAEANDTLSQSSKRNVRVVECVFHFIVQNLLLSVDKDGAATLEDSLRGALHADQVAAALSRLVNGQVVLVGRVEGNLTHLLVLSAVIQNVADGNFHALQNGSLRSVTGAVTKT